MQHFIIYIFIKTVTSIEEMKYLTVTYMWM